jgi:pyridoxine 5-phosphate synthase
MRRLSVSLESMAALREATGAAVDLAGAATLADLAGVDAVRLGLAEELRPVGEADVRAVRRAAPVLELRLAPAPALVKVALEAQPQRVVLASDSRSAPGTAAPLDFRAWGSALPPVVRGLRQAGIAVAALVRPDLDAVKAAHGLECDAVELFTAAALDLPENERRAALEQLGDAARLAAKLHLGVGLSGGLDSRRVEAALLAAAPAERVCMGRAFVARALLIGIERAVRDLLERLRQ